MKTINVWLSALLCCLLLGLACCHTCPGDSGSQNNQTDQLASRHTNDPRWRVLSGLDAAGIYTLYSQVIEMANPPLVNTTDYQGTGADSSVDQKLDSLMDAVCKLVSFYELVASTSSGSRLHAVLTANVEDSCNWLHYLVSNRSHVSGSAEFAALTASCSADDTTRLHHYCLERQVRSQQLRRLVHSRLSDSLHTYYLGRVPATRPRDWLRSTSLSAEQQMRILDVI